MMRYLKEHPSLALVLVLCLSLAACGENSEDYVGGNEDYGDDGNDYSLYGVPDFFEGLAKDSEQMVNLYFYGNVWTGENGGTPVAVNNDGSGKVHFVLCDADEDMAASGFIQFASDYDYDYFYNGYGGMAYRGRFDEGDTLHVTELDTFVQVTGDVPNENVGDSDYGSFAGVQYQDGDPGVVNIIEFDASGSWELLERLGGDRDPIMINYGTIEVDQDGAGQYSAISTIHTDMTHDFTFAGDDMIYWDGEYDYYQKIEQALQKKESDINEEASCFCMDAFYMPEPYRLRQHRIRRHTKWL